MDRAYCMISFVLVVGIKRVLEASILEPLPTITHVHGKPHLRAINDSVARAALLSLSDTIEAI